MRWVSCRPGFFLPVRVLSRLYRRLFLESLQAAFEAGALVFLGALAELAGSTAFARLIAQARQIDWVVYANPPFGGPEQVLACLGRYTHCVAIANSRLVDIEYGQVAFRWKDYRHHDKAKVMTLAADEFIPAFCYTPYRTASIASDTMASSPMDKTPTNSPYAGACSPRQHRSPFRPPQTIASNTRASPAAPWISALVAGGA